jgi:hypothetical protein
LLLAGVWVIPPAVAAGALIAPLAAGALIAPLLMALCFIEASVFAGVLLAIALWLIPPLLIVSLDMPPEVWAKAADVARPRPRTAQKTSFDITISGGKLVRRNVPALRLS